MPWVRVSLMKPKAGRQAEVDQLLTELADYFAEQDGFVEGYILHAKDGLVGRVTIWETEADRQRRGVAGALTPDRGAPGRSRPRGRRRRPAAAGW